METHIYDLCIIGGGINGAGIARDAAGRGLNVALIEAKDLASGTSSKSTKLIHGGLRYLEYYEFKLVRNALKERETLLNIAPHIIWPMEFILPHSPSLRPAWLIRLGLFLYDHLAKRKKLPGSKSVTLKNSPLKKTFTKGFSYHDCWVEDSRLVTLNAMDAHKHGADILTYTKATNIRADDNLWTVDLSGTLTGKASQIKAKKIINAAGPWVKDILQTNNFDSPAIPNLRLIKGSHIIIPKLYEGDHSYILQQKDGRIMFTIPYEHHYTLIGTTEENYTGDPYEAQISEAEKAYLCAAIQESFDHTIAPTDIISTYSGVRSLFDDGAGDAKAVTRDYKLHLHQRTPLPMLSVFGGKLTTYRVLAQKVVNKITGSERNAGWTKTQPLPGGDFSDFDHFVAQQTKRHPFLSAPLLKRYARAYGTHMEDILKNATSMEDLGTHYGDDIYENEIAYTQQNEFTKTCEDFLWRRSKCGLHICDDTLKNLQERFDQ